MCMDVLPISNVCGLCACLLLHRSEEGIGSPGTGDNRWLWATMWMLGTKPTSSARATVLLTTKHSSTHPQICGLSRLCLAVLPMVISASERTLHREIWGENLVCFIRSGSCVVSFQHRAVRHPGSQHRLLVHLPQCPGLGLLLCAWKWCQTQSYQKE